jgi:hypothetical protein
VGERFNNVWMASAWEVAYLDHGLVDADVGVGLEVDAVVLLQRRRRSGRPRPRRRRSIGGGWGGGGEARAAVRKGGVPVEVRRQHGGRE